MAERTVGYGNGTMSTLGERMVEAAARAIYHAHLREEATLWDDLVAGYSDKPGTLGYRALQRCRTQARAALADALAVADGDKVVLTRVPDDVTESDAPKCMGTVDGLAWSLGYYACRCITLKERVTL
jgi:hypothetical protein